MLLRRRPLVPVAELGHVLLDELGRLLLDGVGALEVLDAPALLQLLLQDVLRQLQGDGGRQ